MHTLLAAADASLRPVLVVALNTGMRRGELFKLRQEDVDFQNRFVRVVDSKNGESRGIRMNQTLLATHQKIPKRLDSPYVFAGKTGKPRVDIKKRFATALRRVGIENLRFHDLRHTSASHLVMAGVDLATVRELLGHKSIDMTLRYAHPSPDHKRAAVQRLDTNMDTSKEQGVAA